MVWRDSWAAAKAPCACTIVPSRCKVSILIGAFMRKIYAAVAAAIMCCLFVTAVMAQSAQAPANQTVTPPPPAGQDQMQSQALSPEAEQALARKVVHAILMLPYYGV